MEFFEREITLIPNSRDSEWEEVKYILSTGKLGTMEYCNFSGATITGAKELKRHRFEYVYYTDDTLLD